MNNIKKSILKIILLTSFLHTTYIRTYCFLDQIIIIKVLDSDKIKIEKKSYKNILIYYIAFEYTEECNGNKYLKLVSTDGSKDILKRYKNLWSKIKDIIRPTSKLNNSDNCDEKNV